MPDNNGDFIEADSDKEFVADSPKGLAVTPSLATRSDPVQGPRVTVPPRQKIEEYRTVYYTDPHVGHSIEVILDWLLSDGYSIRQQNEFGGPAEEPSSDVQDLKRMLSGSPFNRVLHEWVERAMVDGHAFMELVVEDGRFRPRVLPTERIHIRTDDYGYPEAYIMEPPNGGPGSEDAVTYEPHEIAELWFRRSPDEEFGHSLIERAQEQADMLRDMEIDYARFVATKAYPPILWKLGTEESQWTEEQIDNWLDQAESIEPDSMLAAPHDVEAEVVGATSTSSSAGAMRLESTFEHLERRIVTGIGIPVVLSNLTTQGSPVEAVMPAFKRRIRRYQQIISHAVERQIFRSLLATSINGVGLAEYSDPVPAFEFGEYSSAENRLEADKVLKLLNNGLLTPEAAAERAGIDAETELPDMWDGVNLIEALNLLAGRGDNIQNPDGGQPTDTGGGVDSAGREVVRRQNPDTDTDDGRQRRSPTEDEDV